MEREIPPSPFMENSIKNFHSSFLNTSLIQKLPRLSGHFPDYPETFEIIQTISKFSKIFQAIQKLSGPSGKYQKYQETFQAIR